jgi:SAM-dependent methyltransferase
MNRWKNNDHKNKWSDKDVERHWDSVADIYVKENNKVKNTHDQRFKETINYLELQKNSVVLNISARDCEANDYILKANSGAKVINTEISRGLMNVAQKIRPYAIQQKIETYASFPFEKEYFNRIICLETLEHVADPIAFLNELHRVSTPGTRMVLSCPPLTSEIPYRIFTFFFGGHGEGSHRFLASKEVKVMFEKTGWQLLLHKGTVLFPVGPAWFQNIGERIINKFQNTFISELGIRQFYVCEKY